VQGKGGVFGAEGHQSPTHQLGDLGEWCKLPQHGPGWSPSRKSIFGRERAVSFMAYTTVTHVNCRL